MYILIPGGLNNCQWLNLKGQHVDISEATKTTYTHFLAESAHSCLGVLMKRNLPQPSIHYQQHYQPIAIKQHSNGQEIPTTTFPHQTWCINTSKALLTKHANNSEIHLVWDNSKTHWNVIRQAIYGVRQPENKYKYYRTNT